jgi:uncharacterized membrane protein (DUF2068 family)
MDERKSFLIQHFGLRGVSLFEAAKGVAALLGGPLLLIPAFRRRLEGAVGPVLRFLHINPDPRFFAGGKVTPHAIGMVLFGFVVYAAIRFIEARGLWLEREWAEWFALLSGGLYLPLEIWELARRQEAWKWIVFILNVVIVLYMLWLRIEANRKRKERKLQTALDS